MPAAHSSGLWSPEARDSGPQPGCCCWRLRLDSAPGRCPPRFVRAGWWRKEGSRCSRKDCDHHGMSPRTGWTPDSLDVRPPCPAAPNTDGCSSRGPRRCRLAPVRWWGGTKTTEEILGRWKEHRQKVEVRNDRAKPQNTLRRYFTAEALR